MRTIEDVVKEQISLLGKDEYIKRCQRVVDDAQEVVDGLNAVCSDDIADEIGILEDSLEHLRIAKIN